MTVQNFEVLNTTGKLIEAKSAWFQWDAVETDPDQMKGEFHGYKVWITPFYTNGFFLKFGMVHCIYLGV